MLFWKYSLLVIMLLWTLPSTAQHSHGVLTPGTTFPKDDSVLRESPKTIVLSFRVPVRLLKLRLLNDDGQWVDIGFRYDPERIENSFVFQITDTLPPANYYIVSWSVLGETNEFMSGEFRFAFGDGALPPSETIDNLAGDQQEILPSTGSYRSGDREE